MPTSSFLRRSVTQGLFVLTVLVLWAFASLHSSTETFMPPPWVVAQAFWQFLVSGELFWKMYFTLQAIAMGLLISLVLAALLNTMAFLSVRAAYGVELITTIMHPMPSVAMIPLVIIWVGIGFQGTVALTVNSCLWPLLLNSYTGFRAVHKTYLEVGRNIGLRGVHLIRAVMIPASLPYLLAGLKVAWARSWRTVVAAEMVFGTTSQSEGIGWFIFEALQYVDFSQILSGILVIIIVGVLMERGFFETLERHTIVKWGMARQ
ncbi:MAG: ABC transporter permease [Nitrospinota bacterium]|nr:MAG: ABC transporter permease [Nitrospinota bacterium]